MSGKGTDAKSSTAVSIEELLKGKHWEVIRKRLKRIASPKRIGELLFYSADDPDIPDDIFEKLLSKLKGNRELRGNYDIDDNFWAGVCNFYRERGYKKKFKQVCHKRSVASLQNFMEEYVEIYGTLRMTDARKTICYLWLRYLVRDADAGYRYSSRSTSTCDEDKENELLHVSSVEDLRRNEELNSLWEKTKLLIKSTKTNGLAKSVQDIQIVHTLLQGCLPRVVVWMALRLYTAQVQVRDEKGRLPLHLAAMLNNIDTEKDFMVVFKGNLRKIIERRMVEIVLGFFPAGAKCADFEGSLPLALLLNLEYRSWTFNNWTQRCVVALMKQAPEALAKRNAEDFMLPFMTAACIHDKNTIKASTKHEESSMLNRKLALTYAVLRSNPTVVASGITGTAQERYLEKKLEDARAEISRLKQEIAELKNGDSTKASQRPTKRSRCDRTDSS